MINFKSNKGVTLIVQVLTITILALVISVISYSSISSLEIRLLNNMYADIISIQEKAANYYLKYGEAPVDYTVEVTEIPVQRNPNDEGGKYYKVDISKLLNLTLNNVHTEENYYYMNTKTLTTYSIKGVIVDEKVYYTLPSNYEDVKESINVEDYQN